ncbi:Uncharacterised protein [Legionella busanensis]|uniref:Uncharacterized protein n=1 Tax=Legionella busanensis TaxID=190655 RepID=A0A378JM53_9GAMM|nr:hypothetical protein [Legionella busanensis]STX52426.1 Uncharacterised protein [Legionella busanensis]
MLRFNNLKNYFLGITLFTIFFSKAFAYPHSEKIVNASSLAIKYSANSIINLPDKQGTLLKGNVKITINPLTYLSADKVLIKFADKKQKTIREFIIFGEGSLKKKQQVSHFKDGIYNLAKTKLTAEKIWQ